MPEASQQTAPPTVEAAPDNPILDYLNTISAGAGARMDAPPREANPVLDYARTLEDQMPVPQRDQDRAGRFLQQHLETAVNQDVQNWGQFAGQNAGQVRPEYSGEDWQQISEGLRREAPSVNPDAFRQRYTETRREAFRQASLQEMARRHRALGAQEGGTTGEERALWLQRRIPFWGSGVMAGEAIQATNAARRIAAGQGTFNDYNNYAFHLHQQQAAAEAPVGEQLFNAATMVPGVALEFMATGGLGGAVRAGVGAGEAAGAVGARIAGAQAVSRVAASRAAIGTWLRAEPAAAAALRPAVADFARVAAANTPTFLARTVTQASIQALPRTLEAAATAALPTPQFERGFNIVDRGNWHDPGNLARGYGRELTQAWAFQLPEYFPGALGFARSAAAQTQVGQRIIAAGNGLAARWIGAADGRTAGQFLNLVRSAQGQLQASRDIARTFATYTNIHSLPEQLLASRVAEVINGIAGIDDNYGTSGQVAYGLTHGARELLGLEDTQGAAGKALLGAGGHLLFEGLSFLPFMALQRGAAAVVASARGWQAARVDALRSQLRETAAGLTPEQGRAMVQAAGMTEPPPLGRLAAFRERLNQREAERQSQQQQTPPEAGPPPFMSPEMRQEQRAQQQAETQARTEAAIAEASQERRAEPREGATTLAAAEQRLHARAALDATIERMRQTETVTPVRERELRQQYDRILADEGEAGARDMLDRLSRSTTQVETGQQREPGQAAPEVPTANLRAPEHPAIRVLHEIFPDAKPTDREGEYHARFGGQDFFFTHNQATNTVHIDFHNTPSWVKPEGMVEQHRAGRAIQDQLTNLVRRFRDAGTAIEYTANDRHHIVYRGILTEEGFEQTKGPKGPGGQLQVRRWEPIREQPTPADHGEMPAEIGKRFDQMMEPFRQRGLEESAVAAQRRKVEEAHQRGGVEAAELALQMIESSFTHGVRGARRIAAEVEADLAKGIEDVAAPTKKTGPPAAAVSEIVAQVVQAGREVGNIPVDAGSSLAPANAPTAPTAAPGAPAGTQPGPTGPASGAAPERSQSGVNFFQAPNGGGNAPGAAPAPPSGPAGPPAWLVRRAVFSFFAPGTRGPEAAATAGIVREHNAVLVRKRLIAEEAMSQARDFFDTYIARQPEAERQTRFLDLMDAIEEVGGKNIESLPDNIRPFAEIMRTLLDQRSAELASRGIVQNFIENYIGHLWTRPGTESTPQDIAAIFFGRRPLAGQEGFSKRRSIPTYREGIEAKLTPVDWNPAKLLLLNLREMDKSIMAHDVVEELKANGLWQFVRLGERAPQGWRTLNDRVARQFAPGEVPIQEYFDQRQMTGLEHFAKSLGIALSRTLGGRNVGEQRPGDIWTRFGTPEEVLIHEIGHELDQRYNMQAWVNDMAFQQELRDLADLRAGPNATQEFRDYIREGPEKIANMVAAYLHAPDVMKQVAPKMYARFDTFLQTHPELQAFRDIKPSLELGQREQIQRLAGPILTGHWYTPDPAATLLENHLSAGLRGNPLFDAVREFSGALNNFQLGFSAFHGAFVFMDTQVSAAALGLQLLSRGEFQKGVRQLIGGIVPGLAPWRAWVEGSKLMKEYYKPGSQGAETAALLDEVIRGGGRASMDTFYGGDHFQRFRDALRDVRYGDAKRIGGVLYNALPALSEVVSKPIMEVLVPRMKLGVMADLARYEMERIGPGADVNAQRAALGRAWDSVENRLGQMTYDNRFWNRIMKDILMVGVRSVGWNVGTFSEIGGGVKDIPASFADMVAGKGITPRTAYVIALPMVTAFYGAILQYLLTGESPQEAKDYFFPRTGRTRRDGSAERLSLPNYMRDIAALSNRGEEGPIRIASNAWHMAKAKLNPGLGIVAEMLNNEDFFGRAIYDPNDAVTTQALDLARHVAAGFEPLAVRNFRRQTDTGANTAQAVMPFFGLTPAPGYITQSAEEQRAAEQMRRHAATPLERRRQERSPNAEHFEVLTQMYRSGTHTLQRNLTLEQRQAVQTWRTDVGRIAGGLQPQTGNPFLRISDLPEPMQGEVLQQLTGVAGHLGDPQPRRNVGERIDAFNNRVDVWQERVARAQRFLDTISLTRPQLQALMQQSLQRQREGGTRVTPGQQRRTTRAGS